MRTTLVTALGFMLALLGLDIAFGADPPICEALERDTCTWKYRALLRFRGILM